MKENNEIKKLKEESNTQNEIIINENNNLKDEISKINENIKLLKQEKEKELIPKIKEYETKIELMKKEIEDKDNNVKEFKNNIEECKNTNNDFNNKIIEKEKEVKNLQSKIIEYNKIVKNYKINLEKKIKELSLKVKTIEESNNKIKEYENNIKIKDENYKKQSEELSQLQNINKNLNEKLKGNESEKLQIKKDNEEFLYNSLFNIYNKYMSYLVDKLNNYKEENNKLLLLNDTITKLKSDNLNKINENKKLEIEINDMKSNLENKENELKEKINNNYLYNRRIWRGLS